MLLVNALDALIPRTWRHQRAGDLLDSLITIVEQRAHIENDLREVVSTLLESDKFESVRSFGLKLADRLTGQYGGTTARKYFDAVYGTRSDLAHGNLRDIPKLSRDALSQQVFGAAAVRPRPVGGMDARLQRRRRCLDRRRRNDSTLARQSTRKQLTNPPPCAGELIGKG